MVRTNVVIDDDLIKMAMEAADCRTKKETIEKGLRLLVQLYGQQQIRRLKGKITWEGDLDSMRTD